ncbi:MaoC family dehydratase N-terminal domain-containing protein [Cupriavidus basilensis]|uniref:MaoC family dehydratase N-terminal domain-containing protein n=1 Tax=Cupriavidus basilensis TaxID=68895 RepID=A0ABT6AS36_9BURK|nr:MaoC family dehydratase N-terminal domain-containing protein [Cupriavidus basilensis]MDF3835431.1 MaoC family dehydratase N-terminal domain-containing protein [Cupriavidus basilensis]
MIDRKWIGFELGSSALPVERGRLQFFAKAIGETSPVYTDESAAHDAGYAGLPAPPTFLFTAELDSGAMFGLLDRLGVKLQNVLHGEQSFEYLGPVVAGDTVTVRSRIKDIYDKKNGALEFIETESRATNQRGELVARMRALTVVRN